MDSLKGFEFPDFFGEVRSQGSEGPKTSTHHYMQSISSHVCIQLIFEALIVLICAQFGEKKKSLCRNLRKVDRLENLSKKDEGASGKLVKTKQFKTFCCLLIE